MPPKVNATEKAPQKKTVVAPAKNTQSASTPALSGTGKGKKQQTEEQVVATSASTEVKEKKPSKYAGVEKGDCPNLATAFAGLHLNVENVKKWLKNHYENYKVERKQKAVINTSTNTSAPVEKAPTKKGAKVVDTPAPTDDKPKTVSDKVMLNNANFALGAVEHTLCLGLVGLIYNKSKKAGAGLYTLSEQDLLTAIESNRDYNFTFGRLLYGYFPAQNYVSQLLFEKKDLSSYIEKFGFTGGNSTVNISGVLNLIAYLMLQSRTALADVAYWSTIAKRGTTVTDRSILCAIPVVYQGQLRESLYRKCEDVMLKISGLAPGDESETGSKRGSKKGSKKTEAVEAEATDEADQDENEDGDDDEAGDEEDGDEDEPEEDEEEPEPEPVPVKQVKKSVTTAKKPVSSAKK